MRPSFDRRVLADDALAFIRAGQARVTCHLGGGAALAGAYLGHRRSGDIDLFVHERQPMRELVELLPDLAAQVGGRHEARRDAGHHHRGVLFLPSGALEIDVVHEPSRDLAGAERIEDVLVESLVDLRASKLTCLLSRTEPRDLVDVLFLERAGFRPEDDLARAAQKDAGTDPAVLAWLLRSFRARPLPDMLVPLTEAELLAYRDELAERLRRLAAP